MRYSEAFELFVFDLDGTLIDSRWDLAASANVARRALGLPALEPDRIAGFIGDGLRKLLERTLGPGASEADLERSARVFRAHYLEHAFDETALYPGVIETLRGLGRERVALYTNKPAVFTERILGGLALDGLFGAGVFSGDTFPALKPDPGGLLAILACTHRRPERTLMVGDLRNDVLAGRAAGTRTCGVLYGYGGQGLLDAGPDLTIDRLERLLGPVG